MPAVGHLSFSGPDVASLGREILYLTERAMFRLRDGQLTLTEIAPDGWSRQCNTNRQNS